jgi:phage shock protein PspC (stress-responsive transcriptional regulator)
MNKTISINLGGRNFFIEEDAYKKLDEYLKAIKSRFAEYAGSEEIVADMESRIGEKFSDKYEGKAQAVITLGDVDSLILELGSVDDIAGDDPSTSSGPSGVERRNNNYNNDKTSFAPKRLMRNGEDKIIAGVASGLAAYFDVDPIIFRALFVILLFAWGTMIPIYLVLWLIMPEAKTPTEKMQMRGQALNLDNIGETIKERAEEFKTHINTVKNKEEWKEWGKKAKADVKAVGEDIKQSAQSMGREVGEVSKKKAQGLANFLRQIFQGLGRLIAFVFILLRRVVSLALIAAFGLAIAGLTLAFVTAVFNVSSPYVFLPIAGIAHTAPFYVLLIAAYVLAFVPILLLLLLAVSLFNLKSAFKPALGFSLFGVWVIALAIGGAVGARYAPAYVEQIKNSPELQTVTKTFNVSEFESLDLGSSVEYRLVQGSEYKIEAEGWVVDLERLSANVSNKTLVVEKTNKNLCIFCLSGRPKVTITAPGFVNIQAANSSTVNSEAIVATSTTLSLSNSSRANINFTVSELILNLSNSSTANLSGSANLMTAKLSNSSRLSAQDLNIKNAGITASNSSVANVNVSEKLYYNISNSSRVYYTGSPQITTEEESFKLPEMPETPIIIN